MIQVDSVSKHFENRPVFENVSFSVPRAGAMVLLGPSGSGKSVLLKIIAGLLKPDRGQVVLGSQDIGMLFQKNALFDSFTVLENLIFPLRERRAMKATAARSLAIDFLKRVGLEGTGPLYPDELSGGMQKRLGIARALIVEPEIILYDEPTAGLDPITSRMIAQLICELKQQRGGTLLAVTNDIHRAYQIGDQIGLLAQNRLTLTGTPEQTKNSKDPAVHQFIFGLKQGPLTSGLVGVT